MISRYFVRSTGTNTEVIFTKIERRYACKMNAKIFAPAESRSITKHSLFLSSSFETDFKICERLTDNFLRSKKVLTKKLCFKTLRVLLVKSWLF